MMPNLCALFEATLAADPTLEPIKVANFVLNDVLRIHPEWRG